MNFFKNKTLSFIITLSALDFNCDSFESFEVIVPDVYSIGEGE
jgi:hypothetical protein